MQPITRAGRALSSPSLVNLYDSFSLLSCSVALRTVSPLITITYYLLSPSPVNISCLNTSCPVYTILAVLHSAFTLLWHTPRFKKMTASRHFANLMLLLGLFLIPYRVSPYVVAGSSALTAFAVSLILFIMMNFALHMPLKYRLLLFAVYVLFLDTISLHTATPIVTVVTAIDQHTALQAGPPVITTIASVLGFNTLDLSFYNTDLAVADYPAFYSYDTFASNAANGTASPSPFQSSMSLTSTSIACVPIDDICDWLDAVFAELHKDEHDNDDPHTHPDTHDYLNSPNKHGVTPLSLFSVLSFHGKNCQPRYSSANFPYSLPPQTCVVWVLGLLTVLCLLITNENRRVAHFAHLFSLTPPKPAPITQLTTLATVLQAAIDKVSNAFPSLHAQVHPNYYASTTHHQHVNAPPQPLPASTRRPSIDPALRSDIYKLLHVADQYKQQQSLLQKAGSPPTAALMGRPPRDAGGINGTPPSPLSPSASSHSAPPSATTSLEGSPREARATPPTPIGGGVKFTPSSFASGASSNVSSNASSPRVSSVITVPGAHRLPALCYPPSLLLTFATYSTVPYSHTDTRSIAALLDCLLTPSIYWSSLNHHSETRFKMFELKRIPITVLKAASVHVTASKNTYGGGAIGIINAPCNHVASFLWDTCSDYRRALNARSDLARKITHRKNDHHQRFFVRTWVPPPMTPRDVCTNFLWKRLDEKRVVIVGVPALGVEYQKDVEALGMKGKESQTIRAQNWFVVCLEEYEDDTTHTNKTKMSFVTIMDSGGHIPKWFVASQFMARLSLVGETMDYFHREIDGSNLKASEYEFLKTIPDRNFVPIRGSRRSKSRPSKKSVPTQHPPLVMGGLAHVDIKAGLNYHNTTPAQFISLSTSGLPTEMQSMLRTSTNSDSSYDDFSPRSDVSSNESVSLGSSNPSSFANAYDNQHSVLSAMSINDADSYDIADFDDDTDGAVKTFTYYLRLLDAKDVLTTSSPFESLLRPNGFKGASSVSESNLAAVNPANSLNIPFFFSPYAPAPHARTAPFSSSISDTPLQTTGSSAGNEASLVEFELYRYLSRNYDTPLKAFVAASIPFTLAVVLYEYVQHCGVFVHGRIGMALGDAQLDPDHPLFTMAGGAETLNDCLWYATPSAVMVMVLLFLCITLPPLLLVNFYSPPTIQTIHTALATRTAFSAQSFEGRIRDEICTLHAYTTNTLLTPFIGGAIIFSFFMARHNVTQLVKTRLIGMRLGLEFWGGDFDVGDFGLEGNVTERGEYDGQDDDADYLQTGGISDIEVSFYGYGSTFFRKMIMLLWYLPLVHIVVRSSTIFERNTRTAVAAFAVLAGFVCMSNSCTYLVTEVADAVAGAGNQTEGRKSNLVIGSRTDMAVVKFLSDWHWITVSLGTFYLLKMTAEWWIFTDQVRFGFAWNNHYHRYLRSQSMNDVSQSGLMGSKQVARFKTVTAILDQLQDTIHHKLRTPITNCDLEYISQIGKGSNATVYLARFHDNIVAVKELDMERATLVDMVGFVAEMELLANLQHPNIIRFERVVMEFPRLSMVMEFAKAGSLRNVLLASPFMDWRNEKRIFAFCVAEGMQYLHTRSTPILHRDLKTMNVLVTEWRGVKISDFGDAVLSQDGKEEVLRTPFTDSAQSFEATKKSADAAHANLVGTKFFMAPEVLRGDPCTKACDVYSYGCVLVDIAMSGKLKDVYLNDLEGAFSEATFGQRIASGLRPNLPTFFRKQFPTLVGIIDDCWDNDPKKRPNFGEIVDALKSWDGEARVQVPPNYIKYSNFVHRSHYTAFTPWEAAFIADGVKMCFDKLRSRAKILEKYDRGFGSTVFTKTLNCNAADVCEFVFDFGHLERNGRAWMDGELARKVVSRVNEHHHVMWTRSNFYVPGVRNRDFLFRQLWQEVSQGNYVVHSKSVKKSYSHFEVPNTENTLRGGVHSVLWAKQNLDSETCECTFILTVDLGGAFEFALVKDMLASTSCFLEYIEQSLARMNDGKWDKYVNPQTGVRVEDPFYDSKGFRIKEPNEMGRKYIEEYKKLMKTVLFGLAEELEVVQAEDSEIENELRGMREDLEEGGSMEY